MIKITLTHIELGCYRHDWLDSFPCRSVLAIMGSRLLQCASFTEREADTENKVICPGPCNSQLTCAITETRTQSSELSLHCSFTLALLWVPIKGMRKKSMLVDVRNFWRQQILSKHMGVPNKTLFTNVDLRSWWKNQINQGTSVDLFIHIFDWCLLRDSLCWDAGDKNKKADI